MEVARVMQKMELALIGGLIWRLLIMATGNIPYNNEQLLFHITMKYNHCSI